MSLTGISACCDITQGWFPELSVSAHIFQASKRGKGWIFFTSGEFTERLQTQIIVRELPKCFPRAKANRSFIFLFYSCITFIYHDEMCLNYMLWMIHTLNVTSPFGLCKLWCSLSSVSLVSGEALPGIPLTLFLMMQPQTPASLPRQLHFVRHKKNH